MKTLPTLFFCLAALLLVAACKDKTGVALPDKLADKLAEMDKMDVPLNASGHPNARITPGGNLLIDGKQIDIMPGQRALLMQYRGQIKAIVQQGVRLGMQGAAIGTTAASAALEGVFRGDADEIGHRLKDETDRIKQEADAMCMHVAELKQVQDALAAQLPAFTPYAGLDQADVDNCRIN